MIPMDDDEDERKEDILKMLGGEVDDFAGKQLPDPNTAGVTVEISIKPHGGPDKEKEEDGIEQGVEPKMDGMEADNEEHDPIAHILGMCGGGCAY